MTHEAACLLAAYAKELFPKVTDAQGAALRDILKPFPDDRWARELLKRLAMEFTFLNFVRINEELSAELRRRGQTTEEASKRKRLAQEAETAAYWDRVDKLIADLSDEDLADLRRDALASLPANARPVYERLDVRKSSTLKSLIAERLAAVAP